MRSELGPCWFIGQCLTSARAFATSWQKTPIGKIIDTITKHPIYVRFSSNISYRGSLFAPLGFVFVLVLLSSVRFWRLLFFTLIDLDECEPGDACCSQFCINYLGGYECSCKSGFCLNPDGCVWEGKLLRLSSPGARHCCRILEQMFHRDLPKQWIMLVSLVPSRTGFVTSDTCVFLPENAGNCSWQVTTPLHICKTLPHKQKIRYLPLGK